MDLGLSLENTHGTKLSKPFKEVIPLPKHSRTLLLPENAWPTIIKPCLTFMVSNN
jgi:hypothetical protein